MGRTVGVEPCDGYSVGYAVDRVELLSRWARTGDRSTEARLLCAAGVFAGMNWLAFSPRSSHIKLQSNALMSRDVEANRGVELDALVVEVTEFGQTVGVARPGTDAMLGLTRLMARGRGLY